MEKITNKTEQIANYEHLNPDIKPIMTGLIDVSKSERNEFVKSLPQISSADFMRVDLYEDPESVKTAGGLKGGNMDYVISPIGVENKFSTEYKNCVGLIVSGVDNETGENVSFLTHQNPGFIFHGDAEEYQDFIRDISIRLDEIKERCKSGTLDAVVFGGQFFKVENAPENAQIQKYFTGEYLDMIKLTSDNVFEHLGFTPEVVSGPKFSTGNDVAIFDNKERRLFIIRDTEGDANFVRNFDAKDVSSESVNWEPGIMNLKRWIESHKIKAK